MKPLPRNLWRGYLVCGLVGIVAYFQLSGPAQSAFYNLFGISAVSAILVGVRRYRPAEPFAWYAAALGLGMLVVGDLVLRVYEAVDPAGEIPFPSWSDAVLLVGNLAIMGALALMIRARVPGGDRGSLIDAAIVATGGGVLVWLFLMAPYAADRSLTLAQQLVAMAYPLVDVVLLALLARLWFAPGSRGPAFRLVVLALASTIVADVIYAELALNQLYEVGHWIDGFWLLWFLFWGAAALHPSMVDLTLPGEEERPHLTGKRLVLLAVATLLLPTARVLQFVAGAPIIDIPVVSVGSGVMFLLVISRMGGLVQALEAGRGVLERALAREQALQRAAEALVGARNGAAIAGVAVKAAADLLNDPALLGRVVSVRREDRDAASPDFGLAQPQSAEISIDDIPVGVRETLASKKSVVVSRADAPGFWQRLAPDGTVGLVVLTPLTLRQHLRALLVLSPGRWEDPGAMSALDALGSQVSLALESAALGEDLHRRKSEERFHALVQNATDVILVAEADGTIRYASPSLERTLGISPGSVLGKTGYALVHPDDEDRARRFYAQVVSSAGTISIGEYRLAGANGRWHHLETVANNLLADPMVRGVVLTMRDVTERNEREEELRAAKEAAEEANRLKSQFLSTMSHELRTPLNAIIGYAHLLAEGFDGPLTGAQWADVRQIIEGADRLLALVNDVLDLSRIGAGMLELDVARVDVAEAVAAAAAEVGPLAAAKGLTLDVDVPAGLTVTADPLRVHQVLLNLAGNAVKFTDGGGVRITGRATESGVEIDVSDTGIGIAPDVLPRVFDEFRQADGSATRRYGGSGLGLAISKRLMELHGGSIRVESVVGQGSTFSMLLPATVPAAE